MPKPDVDYSLYLVTDSTLAILGAGRDLAAVVEAAVRGGVTCVQLRDKTADTGELVAAGRRLHGVCRAAGVPLLINDRVDVALAVGCEGVHVGQDDMDLATARRLLGPDAIVGVTAGNAAEVDAAVAGGADYLGIGTVFATATKENTKSIIGVDGLQQLLMQIPAESPVKTVCIGGINASNASRVVWQSAAPPPPLPPSATSTTRGRALDGIAVVSAVVAAADPEAAARELRALVSAAPAFAAPSPSDDSSSSSISSIGDNDALASKLLPTLMPELVGAVDAQGPLSHNMTNLVVQNLAANVALACGASPIMANYGEEAGDLAALGGALVVNMGTVTPDGLANYLQALRAYNARGRPVVFDPVGAGATAVRRAATKTILGGGYIDVLKGNQAEILSCLPAEERSAAQQQQQQQQKGVDSGPGASDPRALAAAIRRLAALRRNVVLATGKRDYVSDGRAVLAVANGHEYLGSVTGTGCCLGTVVSAFVSVVRRDRREDEDEDKKPTAAARRSRLEATLAAVVYYNVAAELAAERDDVRGPGTFVPAFIDELFRLRKATVAGDLGWLARARVEVIEPLDGEGQ